MPFLCTPMNVLILGSGGREHAFAWKLAQSRELSRLYIAPGNAGTAQHGTNLNIDPVNFAQVRQAVLDHGIHLVLVGPEAPLVAGIRDFFLSDPTLRYIPVIGPSKAGAVLEGSKDFSKAFMQRHRIPTAAYRTFSAETLEEGIRFIDTLRAPYVLKADGLAAGKGVIICQDAVEAKIELTQMLLDAKFGEASAKVVIEEFLHGIELSCFVLTDGRNHLMLPSAKDYKRIGDGDTGLNTGGMGAVSPVPFADNAFMQKVEERIVQPTVRGLAQEGIDYVGFIFVGLMNVNGDPYVIEYNVRMGDPETEVVIPRIQNDLLQLLNAVADGTLNQVRLHTDPQTACTVMLVAGGYPGEYEKGKAISGLDNVKGSTVFHAGTRPSDGAVLTNGGRVLSITSMANELEDAIELSYANAELIHYEGKYFRKDIGQDLRQYRMA